MRARNLPGTDRLDRPEYFDVVGWRVVEVLDDTGAWHRLLAVSREQAAPDEEEWLSGAADVSQPQLPAAALNGTVELVVEVEASGGPTLTELCEVFDEVSAPSIPVLLDIGLTDRREAVAVLEATIGSSVGELLDRPYPLATGEIVTILAPLAETLAELHRAGLALGGLGLEDVRLTAQGRPVVKRWDTLSRLEGFDDRLQPGIVRDWKAFEGFADLVLAQLPTELELPAALERELDRCLSGDVDAELPERLLDALFAWHDASDIQDPAAGERSPRRALLAHESTLPHVVPATGGHDDFDPAGADTRRLTSSLLDGDDDDAGGDFAEAGAAGRDVRLEHSVRARGEARRRDRPEAADQRASRGGRSRRRQRARRQPGFLRRTLGTIRLPFRIAAAAAVVLCICAAALGLLGEVPGGGEDPAPSVRASDAGPAHTAESGPPSSGNPPVNETMPVADSAGAPDWRARAMADDPTVAVLALVERRAECLASETAGCLEEVYQSDAPGLHADLARGGGAADQLAGLTAATLRDRYGDLVVVDLWPADAIQAAETPPASLTIARGEAGWRLRDVRGAAAPQ
ncbi:hypothetical protein C5E07_05560 [Pseudoclavibacter sp. RFBJ3]|uniref:hypothetical protein n=1 Tax=unclassified Pseudoclavibacter TaxID=2615177 RepID=UPI000CE73D7D|nr:MULTISPECIES: hypothetical protein [unclassified Pseudoclavibacter]PPF84962.1 hypothetical protein C5C12_06265 [Pseudoclavibacter sp. RFBJ5]PPF93966.1 hypothetical protein C5E07_05560 [Pseudoclavibacter sp. RFBJ3]PPF98683.1 hypothetical protein C5C19_08545 [Pseudoclavibacter sp. RFBH5]PPG24356.1 hypothetical protein C5E13_06325 [Pseudoclavibacter sp. RFBI4]